MTENAQLTAVVALSVCLVVCVIAGSSLVVRLVSALQATTGGNRRSDVQELRRHQDQVLRLIEKMTMQPAHAAGLHATERGREDTLAAETERTVIENERPKSAVGRVPVSRPFDPLDEQDV